MALPLPPGLTPPEVAFLCENELISVVPRQRLDSLPLLCGPTTPLVPPRTTLLPLWLALLLHRQNRANIVPPAWLSISSLETVLAQEIEHPDVFSSLPPPHSARSAAATGGSGGVPVPATSHDTPAGYLPYHYLSMAHLLLASAPSSFPGSALQALYTLLRDIREVRQSKLRAGMKGLEGGGVVSLRGVGGLEVANERGFVVGVVDGLRTLGASREGARREAQATGGGGGDDGGLSEDEEMEL